MSAKPVMTRDEVEAFLRAEFPQIYIDGPVFHIEAVGPLTATMRMVAADRHIRPGGTISGPAMMALVDVALYVAILANIGPVGLAVTTSLNFNFLRKPQPGHLIADVRLLKLGRRLAVGETSVMIAGSDEVVCHATGTYSIPDRR